MATKRAAIILAAGKGKRMKSDLPKVLHEINGKPIVCYLMETIAALNLERIIVVVGFKGESVIDRIKEFNAEIVWQKEQLGTGHAVLKAEENFSDFGGTVLVAAGDVPFLSKESIERLFRIHEQNNATATCLSAEFDDPSGYGRIIRGKKPNSMLAIIEDKDADPKTKKIKEINSGTFCFDSRELFKMLHRVDDNNAQREYYLTDTIRLFIADGKDCAVWRVPDPFEVSGVNSIEQLKEAEDILKSRKKLAENRSQTL